MSGRRPAEGRARELSRANSSRTYIPREARAEGPSVARLINLSGRAGPSGGKPREFERKIYLYIYIYVCIYVYIFEGVRTMTSDCLASSVGKFAYIEKNMRA